MYFSRNFDAVECNKFNHKRHKGRECVLLNNKCKKNNNNNDNNTNNNNDKNNNKQNSMHETTINIIINL